MQTPVSISHSVNRRLQAKAFSLVELMTTIGIIAFLSALLFPAMTKMQEKSKESKCLSNLKQLASVSLAFASDNDGKLPFNQKKDDGTTTLWYALIWPYAYPGIAAPDVPPTAGVTPEGWKNTIYQCPNVLKTDPATSAYRSYGFNLQAGDNSTSDADNAGSITFPARTAMIGENKASNNLKAANLMARHAGRCNIAYMDGHVASIVISKVLSADSSYKRSFWGVNKYADNWETEAPE